MAITFTIDHDQRLIQTRAEGSITIADFIAHVETLTATGIFAYAQLIDARDATFAPTTQEIYRFTNFISNHRQQYGFARVAFVTTDEIAYGMGRMLMALADATDPGFRIFRSLDEAKAYLQS